MAAEKALEVLFNQAELVRRGSGISEGKLWLFRTAIQMAGFSEVGRSVRSRSGRDLFSTLRDIESMEENLVQGNRSDLAVQCCLILDLAMHNTYLLDPRHMSYHRSTFFNDCQTLREIAELNSRLSFVTPDSDLQKMLAEEVLVAVRGCVDHSAPSWEDMILIFMTACPKLGYPLFHEFADFLMDLESLEVPAVAATLLLSFVADAVHGPKCRHGEIVAIRLLALGASPMVSVDDHGSLLRRIQAKRPREEPQPWWFEAPEPQLESAVRGATALSRLMNANTGPDLRFALQQATCCNLDSSRERKTDFPTKVISLRCMAARSLKASDLTLLSGNLKFRTSKHISSFK